MQGERTVTAALSVAYSGLTAEQARLYRLLGLFPGPSLDIGIAVCVAGAAPETTEDLLDALEDAALLEWDEEAGRYRLPEAARPHARECALHEESEQEREAVLERCVDYYVTGAAFADLAVLGVARLRVGGEAAHRPGAFDPFDAPGRDRAARRRAALAWLAAERRDALAVLRAAAEHGGMARQVWQLAESLTALYLHHRHVDDWRVCCDLGIEAAVTEGEPEAEARLRALLSRPLLDAGEEGRARAELDSALALAGLADDRQLRAGVHVADGHYWLAREPRRAIAAYERALALNEQAGQDRATAVVDYHLGQALSVAGELGQARTLLEDAHQRLRELEDDRTAGRALAALGRVYDAQGEQDAAQEAYENAVRMLRENQAAHYEARALEDWAGLDQRAGRAQEARERLLRALEIHETVGGPRAESVRRRLAEQPPAPPAHSPSRT